MKMNLALLSKKELAQYFANWAEPKFRAEQVFRWIWKEKVFDFNLMSNLSKKLRDRLVNECEIVLPKITTAQKSEDGTIKYLLMLQDFRTVETVWIPSADKSRVTVCISTQVGCKMGCTFCLTAQQKVERNLTAGEIAGQILVLPNSDDVSNVVVMGMGEPFDNYENLMGALDTITDVQGLEIGPKHVTVSTSGLVPKMKQFISESRCRLAVSLNAPNDEIRNKIMPINKAYPLDMLLGALREVCKKDYPKPAASRFYITFEYILIKDLNDKVEHANEVVRRLHGIPAKVNVLLYNENPNVPYKRPTQEAVTEFRAALSKKGLLNFIRTSRGRDISAACGQLVSEHKRSQKEKIQIDLHGAV